MEMTGVCCCFVYYLQKHFIIFTPLCKNLVLFQSAPAAVSFVSPQRREQSELY